MRNKWLLSILMTILALPFFSSAVFAEETVVYEDGEYEIIAKAINVNTGKPSGTAPFLGDKAKLNIKNGEVTITITVPHDPMAEITGLQIEGIQPEETADDTAKYLTFKLANLKSELSAQVQYNVPMMNMWDQDEGFKFVLEGLEKIQVAEEPNEPQEKPTEPVEPEEEEKQAGLTGLKDGYYTVNASYLRDDNDNESTMGNHLEGKLFLAISKGKAEVTATVKKDGTVTLLQLNGKNAVEKKVEGEKRHETFEFDQLQSQLNAYVEYQAPMGPGKMHYGKANFRIVLNEDSITVTDASNKPGANVEAPGDNEEPEEVEKPGDTEVPGEKDTQKPGDTDKSDENQTPVDNETPAVKDNNKQQTPAKKDQLTPDKAYEIDFVIKHEIEDKASSANSFFKGPAILLEKDGERYIQITVTGKEYIDWLKNKFGEMVVVKEDQDSIVYQFKLGSSLSEVILLEMQITVPEIPGYDGKVQKARLFLDESSLKEVDASKYSLVASNNENGPKVPGAPVKNDPLEETDETGITPPTKTGNNDPTIEKPKLGSNETNGSTNEPKVAGQEKNPQTGDTTNILLYVFLLIGSAIPLAVVAKRRFANVA